MAKNEGNIVKLENLYQNKNVCVEKIVIVEKKLMLVDTVTNAFKIQT